MKTKKLSHITLTLGLELILALTLYISISLAAPGNPSPSPLPNTIAAPPTTTVSLTYSETIDAATVTSHTFAVHAFQTGLVTITHGVQGNTIVVTPTRPFHPGELVQTTATTHTLSITGEQPLSYTVWGFFAAVVGGEGVFVPHPISPTFGTGNSADVALGDVDGDGDLDAVVANVMDYPQLVYLNDGVGGFTLHPSAPGFGSGESLGISLGDLDGDGDLDALVANANQPQEVYLNDGSGAFDNHPSAPYFGSGRSYNAALGDVDGDGDLDAVVANGDGDPQDVYLNDGGGAFTAHPSSPTFGAGDSRGVALGDVDDDGDLDAVVANALDVPQDVYLNDGSGAFAAHPISPTFGAGASSDVALGDVDGDGDLDAVVTDGGAQDVYINDGSGAFAPHPNSPSLDTGNSRDVALGDVDGDGDLDAVVANFYGEAQQVYLNDGSGDFSAHPFILTFGAGWSFAVDLGDVDGDGDLDALVANYGTEGTIWLNQQGQVMEMSPPPNSHDARLDASLVITTNNPISLTSVTSRTLFVHGGFQGRVSGTTSVTLPGLQFDPEDDWFPGELVQTSVTSGVLDTSGAPFLPYVWGFRTSVGGGSGSFTPHPISPTFGAGDSTAVALGDVDGDGDLDALVTNGALLAQEVYLNDDSGVFVPHPLAPDFGTSNRRDIAMGDVDGDGDLDAVVINYDYLPLEVYLNDGSGVYSPHPISSTSSADYSFAVVLGDVDGDGDLDALVANYDNQPQDVYLNDGSGVYSPHPISPTFGAGDSSDVVLGDVDDDGDLDALVANDGDQAQDVYLNNGSGAFSPHPSAPTFGAGQSRAIDLGDVDDDGDLDALVANYDNQPQDVYLNDGNGVFAPHPSASTFGAGNSNAIGLGDIDGDGDLDALIANWNQPQAAYLNDGSGAFAPHPNSQSFGADYNSSAIAMGDVDGDSDLDALVANWDAALTVWLNRSHTDLSITKAVEPDLAAPGDPITYTLTFVNHGPETATGVVVSDSVPASVTGVSDAWSVVGGEITRTPGVTFEWTVSRLGPGEGGVITITGLLSDALPHEHVFSNTVVITGVVVDADTLDNEGTALTTIDAQAPDLPVLRYPPDGAFINDATPILVWQASASPDLAGYLLDLSGAVSDLGNITYYAPPTLDDGAYTWTVAAYDEVDNTSAYTDTWTFTVDTILPQMMAFSPPDAAQDVALDVALIITFSEAIRADSLDYSVTPDPGGWSATWGGETTTLPGGSILTLTHNLLTYETTYTVTLNTATDGAGNPLSNAPVQWSFTTLFVPDTISPTVVAFSPPHAAQDVALDAALVITFSEAINAASLDYSVSPDPGDWSADWSVDGTVVTMSHAAFASSTAYSVTLSVADDLAGNPLSVAPVQWSFTTRDAIPPTVLAHSPPDAAQEVALDATLVITFSETISAASLNYSVSPDPGGWSADWNVDGTVVTMSHNAFAAGAVYTVTLDAADDLAGNLLAGAPVQWSFSARPHRTLLPLMIKYP
jgi:uncharacterized repeat protein (TIGR01451 family)